MVRKRTLRHRRVFVLSFEMRETLKIGALSSVIGVCF